ncbi:MAG: L,D-transpeptidase family protein [Gammaproteobacteria bacterium]
MNNYNSIELIVNIATQELHVHQENNLIKTIAISTAKNGVGEINGSECTPRGRHKIRAKIGLNSPVNTVFVGRRGTNEIYSPNLRLQFPQRDWILTRIMWLSGLEIQKNRFGNVDTMKRYIYIHGCPDEDEMGIPSSHGCIKMRNNDVIELFDLVNIGTIVTIQA